jgi:predicted flap endonuclease-1-like 5' DNA nuclease
MADLLQNLSVDALLFFTTHAMLVVLVCAVVFFLMGLYFGFLTWAKFKRRSKAYYEEIQIQRSEIANLKRRLSERPTAEEGEDLPAPVAPVPVPLIPVHRPTLAEVVLAQAPTPEPETPTSKPAEPAPKVAVAPVEAPKEPEVAKVPAQEPTPVVDTPEPVPAKVENKKAELVAELPALPVFQPTGPITQALARSVDDPKTESATSSGSGASAHGAVTSTDLEASLRSGQAAQDERLGLVYHSRPERYDDLTLLRGVGESLHAKLQEHGIFTFRQIAMWSESNVQEFDVRLAAKDRIHREQWVKQARNLHFLKYGEQLHS